MPIHAIQRRGPTVEVVVGDALTERDVELIRDALALGPPGTSVTVDLRRARTTDAATLLALSRALSGAGARFDLVGLTSASERLLRYLDAGAPRVATPVPTSSGSDS